MTRIALAAPTRHDLDALADLLGEAPHLVVVERVTRVDDLGAPHIAAQANVALVRAPDLRRLRASLAGLDEHALVPPLVVLGDLEDPDVARALVRLGVRALLPGNASAREVHAALDAVAAGLHALAPEALELLLPGTGRPTQASAPPAGSVALSPREREILALVAEGLGNKIVAARLGISEHTVKTHIASIFTKLGADTRAAAVAIGARQGVILL